MNDKESEKYVAQMELAKLNRTTELLNIARGGRQLKIASVILGIAFFIIPFLLMKVFKENQIVAYLGLGLFVFCAILGRLIGLVNIRINAVVELLEKGSFPTKKDADGG